MNLRVSKNIKFLCRGWLNREVGNVASFVLGVVRENENAEKTGKANE